MYFIEQAMSQIKRRLLTLSTSQPSGVCSQRELRQRSRKEHGSRRCEPKPASRRRQPSQEPRKGRSHNNQSKHMQKKKQVLL